MAVEMNLRITKNHAADPEKRFHAKSISKSNGYATAMPTAWEFIIIKIFRTKNKKKRLIMKQILLEISKKSKISKISPMYILVNN